MTTMRRRALKISSSLRRLKNSSEFSTFLLGSQRSSSFHTKILADSSNSIENCYFLRAKLLFSSANTSTFLGFRQHYATAAEAIAVTPSKDDDRIRELVQEIKDHESRRSSTPRPRNDQRKQLVKGMSQRKYNILLKRQVKMETEAWEEAAKECQELLTNMCQQKLAPNLPYMKSLCLGWFEPLRNAIAAEQDSLKGRKSKKPYAPYWDLLPADMMAVITMHKMMGLLMSGADPGNALVVHAACQIGAAIEHEVRINRFFERTKNKKTATTTEEGPKSLTSMKTQERLRKKVNTLIKLHHMRKVMQIVKDHDDMKPWGQENQAKVGARLVQLLMETAYIQLPANQISDDPPDVRPAFIHTTQIFFSQTQKNGKRYGIIECDPLVRKGLEKTARHMVIPHMPMLVPPLKWIGYDKGAYICLPSYVMHTNAKQQREAVKGAPINQLDHVFEALDTLGNTKWRVNKRVLNIIDTIWASGGRIADMVDREDIALPEEPDTEDEKEIKKWKWNVKKVKKVNSERQSLRCDIELKIAVARKMQDEDGFYYPHNIDFRGRAYPMHSQLNHLGSDLCRGILEFAEGRPLGKSGLRWLKIHLANLYAGGVDKLSYDGRIAFTENHLHDIFDTTDRPLEGNRWWLGAEDPFQCLAACINLTDALRSPSPEAYVSYMPVHQDGLCNGLQHYAALGRDKLGAAAVNLVVGDKPADVYLEIAARVLDIMRRDAQKDPAIEPNAHHAKLLISQVDRKLVTQTVMTSVYGVTYIGACNQIKRRLKERCAIEDDAELFSAACYADKTTLTTLGDLFEAARSIMSWLGDCAKIIASENHPVRWTTPLGLPVVQPYYKFEIYEVKTSLQSLSLKRDTDKVMARRQSVAFPPNFIHSLDGSHMMMTAIVCKKAGLNFAGVHDSFWTHASDVDEMNRILREKFVELYELPILEDLVENFQKSFPNLEFPPLPEHGDFDLREVLESPYFFH